MFIKDIGVKIQIMGQIIGFLGIFVSLIMIFTGCANYFNYTYPDIEDMSTAILGFVFMLSSICTLYLTQGFGQLIINSEKIASFISKEDQENLLNKTVESNVSKQKIVPEPVLQQKKEYQAPKNEFSYSQTKNVKNDNNSNKGKIIISIIFGIIIGKEIITGLISFSLRTPKQKAFIGLYPKARKLQNIKQLFNKRLQNTTNVIPLL